MRAQDPVIICYIPVIHSGYLALLRSHPEAKTVYLLDYQLVPAAKYLYKDIRALTLPEVASALAASSIPQNAIEILSAPLLKQLSASQTPVILPDEDITRQLVADHLRNNPHTFVPTFLRWHRLNSTAKKDVTPDVQVTSAQLEQELMKRAFDQAAKSSDFWRQVGCVIQTTDGQSIVTHNTHLPSEYSVLVNGSPRGCFHRGIELDKSSAIHAEQLAVATAAHDGVSLSGAKMYVTTFPCPVCAKLIATSGISELYFAHGYTVLDGSDILQASNVVLKKVEL